MGYRKQLLRDTKGMKPVRMNNVPLNYDSLPAVEDVYTRLFSGNATADPPGGRRRVTWWIFFKNDPREVGNGKLEKNIKEYMRFFKFDMSCKDLKVKVDRSPIDGKQLVTMEYPMKEYGELQRGKKVRPMWNQAIMVKFDFAFPEGAQQYIERKIYNDNNVIRHMRLGHTTNWSHRGE